MKKMILTCVIYGIILFVPMFWIAGTLQDDSRLRYISKSTTVKAEQDTLALGNIRYGTTRKSFFRLRNTGSWPLIIHEINSSCGCIEMKWEKQPIYPDSTEHISVDFTPTSLGRLDKSIEVYCNIKGGIYKLHLTGYVEEDQEDHTTTK